MFRHVLLACVLFLASPQFAAARTTASAVAMSDVAEETKRAALPVPRHVSAEPVATAPGQAPEFSLMRSDVAANASFAYVAILYMGTPRDYEYYVATRVMLQTVRRTGTAADLVVLASEDVPDSWTNTLKKEGVRVVRVNNIANPYKGSTSYNPRFPFALNKLLAWRLKEYKRVVLLDADNLVLKNVDELFRCGSMCAVFINPCTFHTGLIVLKPSVKVFKDMMQQLRSLPSFDAADQGFLNQYFSALLSAPLFAPPDDGSALKGQFRLPMGYQMDAIYYNLKFKWEVPCSDNKIITFPGVSQLKPWLWWSYPLLALSLQWHSWRLSTLGYSSHLPACLSAGVFWLVVLALSHVIARAAADPSSFLYRLTRGYRHVGAAPVVSGIGGSAAAAGGGGGGAGGVGSTSPYSRLGGLGTGLGTPGGAPSGGGGGVAATGAAAAAGGALGLSSYLSLRFLLTLSLVALSAFVSFSLVPTTVHPFFGWALFIFGTFSGLSMVKALVGATAAIYWLLQYLVLSLILLGLPVYSSLAFKLCAMHLLAFGAGAVLLAQLQALQYGFITGAGLAPRPTSSSGGRSLLD
ncbi:hypothetical protein CLOM_g3275 [Closterium sp. NIES-68]|nr:hypothetical protein CLOM_g3275 [Closterium sp. NIES-68]GJP67989.1 hypothetical protein CLOP_g24745 [Closterium sp. NIES-67]GJP73065.1 hypothetical protein CLOP_g3818 [Closterium sp. NIES-67]